LTITRQTEADILAATARKLEEEGYDVVVGPSASLLPDALKPFRPDGIAIGKSPNLVIEVANEGPRDAKRVADLQRALKATPDWRLHLVLGGGSPSLEIAQADERSIAAVLDRASKLIVAEPAAALLLAWAALEALSRSRMPHDFARPQSPGRIVERLASEGIITPSEATLLRSMAMKRNTFIHGDLAQRAATAELESFLSLIQRLMNSPALRFALDKAP
jgi:hypothetical protein